MKFGVSYNIFNSEEHLIPSILNIREHVDYINIVVQYMSNINEPATEELYATVEEIKKQNLVNDIIEYTPDLSVAPQINEFNKRVQGLDLAKQAGVAYFMTMDADEYYLPDALKSAKDFLVKREITLSVARTYLHIKRPIYRSLNPDSTNVCFFSRIDNNSKLVYNGPYPVNTDPTRRINGDLSKTLAYFFNENDLAMMHMNLVRSDNLISKLKNTSSGANTTFINQVKTVYDQWQPGDTLNFPNKEPMEIITVPDYFNLDSIFSNT
jgi:hypothetical protein